MEIVAYSPSFVNGAARLFGIKSVQKSAPQKTRGGKLFVKFLPLCLSPAPPRIIKIRKNVRIRRKKVGKTCESSRKTQEKCVITPEKTKKRAADAALFFVGDLLQKRILTAINFGIQTAFFEECLVRSRFDHFSVVDHKNDVCVNYS